MLTKLDKATEEALRRLSRGDQDFQRVLTWLEHSLAELDRGNRVVQDGILLRQQQGAAATVADFLAKARGNAAQLTVAK